MENQTQAPAPTPAPQPQPPQANNETMMRVQFFMKFMMDAQNMLQGVNSWEMQNAIKALQEARWWGTVALSQAQPAPAPVAPPVPPVKVPVPPAPPAATLVEALEPAKEDSVKP